MALKVLIADPNYLSGKGLECMIGEIPGLAFAGICKNYAELELAVINHEFDVVVMDHLSADFGMDAVRMVRQEKPKCGILAITDMPRKRSFSEAVEAGVNSYVLRECEREEIVDAIQAAHKGDKFYCGKIVNEVMQSVDEIQVGGDISCDGIKLSAREAEIIRYVAEGLTNKEIADLLFLSSHTVTTHRKNIMAKLGVNNTAGLVMFAIKNGIVSPNHFLFSTN
jgi:DNA-binding NarL/FixJ family response regulator